MGRAPRDGLLGHRTGPSGIVSGAARISAADRALARRLQCFPGMTLDGSNKPPQRTTVLNAVLTRIDVGRVISNVARTLWGEVEARAGLVIELDAWGPAVGEERLLERLLRGIVLELTHGVPQGDKARHAIGISSRASPGEALWVEVRHVAQPGSLAAPLPPLPPELVSGWERSAEGFAASVELIDDPRAARSVRVTLSLAS